MEIGEVIRLRTLRAEYYDDDGKWRATLSYRAPKGQTFELILMGTAPLASPLDANAWLGEMGWERIEETKSEAHPAKAAVESLAVAPSGAVERSHA